MTAVYPAPEKGALSTLPHEPGGDGRPLHEVIREANAYLKARGESIVDLARAAGMTVAEYAIAIAPQARAAAAEAAQKLEPGGGAAWTDIANAERLIAAYGDELRYCHQLNTWYVWNGKRWEPDEDGKVARRAHLVARAIYREAAAEGHDERRKKLVAWAMKSESRERLRAMVDLARDFPDVAITADRFDADPWALNVLNGTIDLRTGVLYGHRREDLITKLAPVRYDETAMLELWDRFLETALPDPDTRHYVQKLAGYSLVGVVDEDVLVVCHGPGGTGKSTIREAIDATLGDYSQPADFEAFAARRATGGARPELIALRGARMVAVSEVDSGQRMAAALVKQLTGGDQITARGLYQSPITFAPTFTMWIVANDRPQVREDDTGIWRRLREVPFKVRMLPPDRTVREQLRRPEVAGAAILAWAVAGCLAWQRDGLGIPPEVQEATAEYRLSMDPLGDFLSERCVFSPDAQAGAYEMYANYVEWAHMGRLRTQDTLSKTKFGQALAGRFERRKTEKGRVYIGIGLQAAHPAHPDGQLHKLSDPSARDDELWQKPAGYAGYAGERLPWE